MAWLAKAWRWLVAAAVAVPAVFSLWAWGSAWKRRAKVAETARRAALKAASAASDRMLAERRIRDAHEGAIRTLRDKVAARDAEISAQAAEIDQLASVADQLNRAFEVGGDE